MRAFQPVALLTAFVTLVALAGCGPRSAPEFLSPELPGDSGKLQGLWAVESAEDCPHSGEQWLETLRTGWLKFDGNRLTLTDRQTEIKFTFTPDEGRDPKVLALTEVVVGEPKVRFGQKDTGPTSTSRPPQWNWIYKFEGPTLVVAFEKFGKAGENPTEFAARAPVLEPGKLPVPGVTVLRLKLIAAPVPPSRRGTQRSPTTQYSATRRY
jgi:uncharacterized protein (TIGR03067 family)